MRDTAWFYQKKWGVFIHLLESDVNGKKAVRSLGRETGWDECLQDFDCAAFAARLHAYGAGYLMVTVMQVTRYMLAPNETYNRITGYRPGEACPTFDFIGRLYQALEPYGIDLFLYFTGDGPSRDPQARDAFGAFPYGYGDRFQINRPFVEKWAEVAREYSLRYGRKIKGWWIDGAYRSIGYNEELLAILHDAMRAGNPDALIASNYYGCIDEYGCIIRHVRKGAPGDDYSAGEMVAFEDLPYAPFFEGVGARWHILSFLGCSPNKVAYEGWGLPGSKYTGPQLQEYIRQVHERGGVVTVDICAYRDGSIDPVQDEVLTHLKHI